MQRKTNGQRSAEQRGSTTNPRNEGEGNRTAAKAYDEAAQRFAKSGQVKPKAEEAAAARSGSERQQLDRAEAAGKERAKEEDPQLRRDYTKSR